VTALVAPSIEYHASFLAALQEFQAEKRNLDLDARLLVERDAFASYVDWLHRASLDETRLPDGIVPATSRWAIHGREYVGTLQIRHSLTETLRTIGGHIGYEVRPSARRRGHATRMLALALPIAHALGIDPALVTCDNTNIASRRVIEYNGGKPDDPIGVKLRYWIPTA
jgi:predicted acetyltransferase